MPTSKEIRGSVGPNALPDQLCGFIQNHLTSQNLNVLTVKVIITGHLASQLPSLSTYSGRGWAPTLLILGEPSRGGPASWGSQ